MFANCILVAFFNMINSYNILTIKYRIGRDNPIVQNLINKYFVLRINLYKYMCI